jgi:solute carrier family 13 (sodium-dependent dicarboxylate transporter), member 2/3/5
MLRKEKQLLGSVSYEEKIIMFVFVLTAFCWMTRSFLLVQWMPFLDDTMIAIFAALLLFLLPAKNGDSPRILAWKDAEKIPWGILLLFGGGSAIGEAFQTTGLAKWIGEQMTILDGLHFAFVIIAVVILVIILSEFTSNIATSIMVLPIMGSLAVALGVHPYMLLFAAGVATSCAFMLPTAATPNTIMFATGQIPVKVMIRAGFWMNLFCLGIITLMIIYFMPLVWGIDITIFPENMKNN